MKLKSSAARRIWTANHDSAEQRAGGTSQNMRKPSEDIKLLRAWQDGDRHAGQQLITRYLAAVQRYFANKVESATDIADLVSQTFLGCTSTLERVDGRSGFRPFLFGVASNVYHAYLRRRSKRSLEQRDFELVCVNEVFSRTMSSVVMGKRRAQAFVDGLGDLPLRDQALLEYRYFLGYSAEEIAAIVDRPASTVRGRLMRARERLRDQVVARLADANTTVPAPSFDDIEAWSATVQAHLGERFGTLADEE